MEYDDVKRIIFECLDDAYFIGALKTKIFNMDGLKTQADFDAQQNRINEMEAEKRSHDAVLGQLRDKITELESANDDLVSRLEQVKAQYKNDEIKLEQYRTDMKNYLEKLETQEKEINELDNENKKLQTQLAEAEEHFKTASAESIKNLQELKKLEAKVKSTDTKSTVKSTAKSSKSVKSTKSTKAAK